MKKRILGILAASVIAATCMFGVTGCGFLGDYLDGNENPDTGEADDYLDQNGTELPHTHSYTGTKIYAATCTKGGYTLHICDCGDSKRDSEVDALGHDFVNYVCSRCKEVDPDAPVTNGLKFAPFTDANDEITSYQVVGVEDDAKNAEKIEIPATYNGKPVTAIGKKAFYNCKMKSIIIPESVTEISELGFYYCVKLESVTLPESVTVIDYEAFSTCAELKTVTLGSKVTEIGNRAFENCVKLTQINLPSTLETIGIQAFWQCRALENITLPEGIRAIYEQAFEDCESLQSLHVPASVTNIGCGLTAGCNGLTQLTVASGNKYYRSSGNCIIQIDRYNNGYSEPVIAGCPESIIPEDNSVFSIGYEAFRNMEIRHDIPQNIKQVDTRAFENSHFSNNATFLGELLFVGAEAFRGCWGSAVRFAGEIVEPYAFANSGMGVILSDNVRVIRKGAFQNAHVGYLELPESIRVIEWAFQGSGLNEVVIRGDYGDSWKVCLQSRQVPFMEINVDKTGFTVENDYWAGNVTRPSETFIQLLNSYDVNDLVELLNLTPEGMTLTNYSIRRVVPGEENQWWNTETSWWDY